MRCVVALPLLLLAPPALLHAGELKVRVEALPCPDPIAMAAEIRAHTEPFMADKPDASLLVFREGSGDISLFLSGAVHPFETQISRELADCAELPMMVSLIVRSWLDASWRSIEPPPQQQLRSPVEPDPSGVDREGPGARAEPTFSLFATLGPGLPEFGGESAGWSLASTAGASYSLNSNFGLSLAGHFDGPLAKGAARAELYSAAAAAWLRWPLGESELLLSTGPALALLHGHGGKSEALLGRFAWVGALHLALPLGAGVKWLVGLEAVARSQALLLRVRASDPPLTLQALRLSLATGPLITLF